MKSSRTEIHTHVHRVPELRFDDHRMTSFSGLVLHHRPGNVHDSRGAEAFIEAKIADVRSVLPRARLESRLDSAFFSETLLVTLERLAVEFSISVPFERFPGLHGRILRRTSGWKRIDDGRSFVEVAREGIEHLAQHLQTAA